MKRLNEISDIIMGQSPASSTYNTIGEGYPFFQGNADFGMEHPNVRVYCSLPTKMSEKGDVLISVRAPIGAVNLANQRCCIGRGLAAVRPLEGKSQTRYLYHLLIANREALESKGTGSTFKAITGKVLNDVNVPSYNMEQQKEIARVLDTVVAAIRKRQKQIAFYNDLVKSQFIEMFGGDQYPDCQIKELVAERVESVRKRYKPEDRIRYVDISSIDNKLNPSICLRMRPRERNNALRKETSLSRR